MCRAFLSTPSEPDPARRWKIYGYATLVARRRAGCFAYSADGRKWTAYPRNPILDPTVSEVPMVPSGPESQIHDTVVFPYRGYYLALFHAQHDANFLDVELATSRDGEHFVHVKRGHKVLPLGPRRRVGFAADPANAGRRGTRQALVVLRRPEHAGRTTGQGRDEQRAAGRRRRTGHAAARRLYAPALRRAKERIVHDRAHCEVTRTNRSHWL